MPTPPANPTHLPAAAEPAEGGTAGAGFLVILGGVLIALGGLLLGLALGGAWVLLTSILSLPVGLVMGMLGLFGALSRSRGTHSRFNLLRGLGLVGAVGGLALAWYLGGLTGVGAGLLLLGLAAFSRARGCYSGPGLLNQARALRLVSECFSENIRSFYR